MKLKDLQPGDVILTTLNQKPPALHAQLYEGDTTFEHTILHAVDDSGKKLHKLMATSIRASKDYLVFRCKVPTLAVQATAFGKKWAMYQTPYDNDRKYVKEAFRNVFDNTYSAEAIPNEMARIFDEKGKFRAIKYATRREETLCYPDEAGESRGLTCTMFVILCFQVAALAPHVLTRTALGKASGTPRVSDKKLNEGDLLMLDKLVASGKLDGEDLRQYKAYVASLQSGNEYRIDWELSGRDKPEAKVPKPQQLGFLYVPSLFCWNAPVPIRSFSFETTMTKGMMLDSKIATSNHLLLCLDADNAGWENLGFLDGEEKSPQDPGYKEKLSMAASLGDSMRKAAVLRPGQGS